MIENNKKKSELNNESAYDRYTNRNIYYEDNPTYYGPDTENNIIGNNHIPKDKVIVSIEMRDDILTTFPSFENLKVLKNKFDELNHRKSIKNILLTGKYQRDPEAYYDPGRENREIEKLNILKNIQKVEEGLIDKNITYETENYYNKTKIQNSLNGYKEHFNEMIAESYYYNGDFLSLI